MGVEGKSAESREKGQKIIVWRCKRENEDSVSRLALKSNQPINNQACVYYYYYYYDNVCESERRVIPSSCAAAAAAGTHRVFTLYKCGSCIFWIGLKLMGIKNPSDPVGKGWRRSSGNWCQNSYRDVNRRWSASIFCVCVSLRWDSCGVYAAEHFARAHGYNCFRYLLSWKFVWNLLQDFNQQGEKKTRHITTNSAPNKRSVVFVWVVLVCLFSDWLFMTVHQRLISLTSYYYSSALE